MLLSELRLLIASPSMAGGMLLCTHIGAGGFSVWWHSNIRSCMHLVMSVPLKWSLLGQFLAHQTSEKVKHRCVKKAKKMGKSGQKNAVISCKLPGEIAVPSDTLQITVLLSYKSRKSNTAPQTGSFQILWGHTAVFSHSIKYWSHCPLLRWQILLQMCFRKFFSSLKTI